MHWGIENIWVSVNGDLGPIGNLWESSVVILNIFISQKNISVFIPQEKKDDFNKDGFLIVRQVFLPDLELFPGTSSLLLRWTTCSPSSAPGSPAPLFF